MAVSEGGANRRREVRTAHSSALYSIPRPLDVNQGIPPEILPNKLDDATHARFNKLSVLCAAGSEERSF